MDVKNQVRTVSKTDDNTFEFSSFLADDIRASMLNEHYEIGVGDEIYVYFSENQAYKIGMGCVSDAEVLRSLEKGVDTFNPQLLLTSAELVTEGKFKMSDGNFKITSCSGSGNNEVQDLCPVGEITLMQDFASLCETNSRVFDILFKELVRDCDDGTITDVNLPFTDYSINYGDGTTTTRFNKTGAIEVSHTYATSGSYLVRVFATTTDGKYVSVLEEMTVDIEIDAICSNSNAGKSYLMISQNIDRAMQADFWYNKDFFGTHIGAKTTGYEILNGNPDDLEKKKGRIYVSTNFKWMSDDCSLQETSGEIDSCSNCKDKKAVKTALFNKGRPVDGVDIESYHEFEVDGVLLVKTINLELCE